MAFPIVDGGSTVDDVTAAIQQDVVGRLQPMFPHLSVEVVAEVVGRGVREGRADPSQPDQSQLMNWSLDELLLVSCAEGGSGRDDRPTPVPCIDLTDSKIPIGNLVTDSAGPNNTVISLIDSPNARDSDADPLPYEFPSLHAGLTPSDGFPIHAKTAHDWMLGKGVRAPSLGSGAPSLGSGAGPYGGRKDGTAAEEGQNYLNWTPDPPTRNSHDAGSSSAGCCRDSGSYRRGGHHSSRAPATMSRCPCADCDLLPSGGPSRHRSDAGHAVGNKPPPAGLGRPTTGGGEERGGEERASRTKVDPAGPSADSTLSSWSAPAPALGKEAKVVVKTGPSSVDPHAVASTASASPQNESAGDGGLNNLMMARLASMEAALERLNNMCKTPRPPAVLPKDTEPPRPEPSQPASSQATPSASVSHPSPPANHPSGRVGASARSDTVRAASASNKRPVVRRDATAPPPVSVVSTLLKVGVPHPHKPGHAPRDVPRPGPLLTGSGPPLPLPGQSGVVLANKQQQPTAQDGRRVSAASAFQSPPPRMLHRPRPPPDVRARQGSVAASQPRPMGARPAPGSQATSTVPSLGRPSATLPPQSLLTGLGDLPFPDLGPNPFVGCDGFGNPTPTPTRPPEVVSQVMRAPLLARPQVWHPGSSVGVTQQPVARHQRPALLPNPPALPHTVAQPTVDQQPTQPLANPPDQRPEQKVAQAPANSANKTQEMKAEVLGLFPDADPDYILSKLGEYGDHPSPMNLLCNYLLENPSYPRAARKQADTPPKPVPTEDTQRVDFVKDYYKIPVRSIRNAIDQLKNDVRWIANDTIRAVLYLHNNFYAPTRLCLEDVLCNNETVRKMLQPGRSYPPNKRQIEVNITTKDHKGKEKSTTVMFKLLKNRRPIQRVTSAPGAAQLAEEIQGYKDYLKNNAMEKDFHFAQSMNEAEYEAEGQLIECGCCSNEVTFETMIQCLEGHLFCETCLQSYTKEAVYGQGRAQLSCMTAGCGSSYPRDQMEKCLTPKDMAKYDERVQEEAIRLASMEDLVCCPHCDFAALLDPGDKVFSCQNADCRKETCRHCKEDWKEHFGKRCEEIEKKSETNMRTSYEEKMSQAQIRTCHRCKTGIMKDQGCNKMTCRCGSKMCYICRAANIDYNHFCAHPRDPGKGCQKCSKCSLWTDPSEDDAQAVKELELELKNEQNKLTSSKQPLDSMDLSHLTPAHKKQKTSV